MRALILITSILLSASAGAAERIVRESIRVDADVRFSVTTHRGELELTTGNVDAIEITVYIEHEDQEAVDEVEVNIDSSRSNVSIDAYFDERNSIINFNFIRLRDFEYPKIRFVVVLPDGASLNVEAHRSELSIAAPAGRINIDTSRTSGHITGIRNDIDIVSARGNFDLEILELHDVDVEAQRGNVRLDIFGATDFTLSGETNRGNVRIIGADVDTHARERGERVEHVSGSGNNFVSFEVERGDMTLNFRN